MIKNKSGSSQMVGAAFLSFARIIVTFVKDDNRYYRL